MRKNAEIVRNAAYPRRLVPRGEKAAKAREPCSASTTVACNRRHADSNSMCGLPVFGLTDETPPSYVSVTRELLCQNFGGNNERRRGVHSAKFTAALGSPRSSKGQSQTQRSRNNKTQRRIECMNCRFCKRVLEKFQK